MTSLLPIHSPRRALLATLAVLALLALLLVPAVAPARMARSSARSHSGSCAAATRTGARHAKRTSSKHHCAKHQARKHRSSTHKTKKSGKAAAPTVVLTPAVCEDGSLPSHAGGGTFSCGDGSQPACEDGDAPARANATSAPMCKPESEVEVEIECLQEASGECQTGEFACADSRESSEAGQTCEAGPGEEATEPEA